MSAPYNLSQLTPDFEGIEAQFLNILAQEKTWKGNESSPVGASLIRLLSTIGTFDQHKILRGIQDAFPETALSDRAIYAAADFQGVRVARKTPASATATLTSTTSISIPAYTQFQSSGTFFFNRVAINLLANVAQSVTFYQGQVNKVTTVGLGTDFQMYSPPESSFAVSDTDVLITVNSDVLQRVTEGLWNYKLTPAFQDRTLPDGRLMIHFGTSAFGYMPLETDVVDITYVVTAGSTGNSFSTLTNKVFTDYSSDISGEFTTNPADGRSEQSPFRIKTLPSPYFGTFDSAITARQTRSLAMSFPGVTDARTFAQREVNPRALKWFNLVRFVLVTDTVWNDAQFQSFKDYIAPRVEQNWVLDVKQSIATSVDVTVNVYFYNYANLTEGKTDVENAIQNVFIPRRGMIDFDIYRSDLARAIQTSNAAIEYFELISPSAEVTIMRREAAASPTGTIHANAGVLNAGDYMYGVLTKFADGNVTVRNWTEVSVVSDVSVELSWDPVPGAIGYDVYVENDTHTGLLASLPATTTTFTDDGALTPTGVAPAFSTAPTRHPVLGNLSVQTFYSSRVNGGA